MTARLAPADKTSSAATRSTEGRRANKPLMEKRRRARINQSLAVLKSLILDSARLENTKHSKLEKADILELTVRHLQRQRALGTAVLSKYRAGFQECTREVTRFLEGTDSLDASVKQRLVQHLQSCVSDLDAPDVIKAEADNSGHREELTSTPPTSQIGSVRPDSTGDENNNRDSASEKSPTPPASTPSPAPSSNPLLSVVQVVPSRLPDGQIVFLLPSHYVQLAAAAGLWSSSPRQEQPELADDSDSEQPLDCSRKSSSSASEDSHRGSEDEAGPMNAVMAAGIGEPDKENPVWRPW